VQSEVGVDGGLAHAALLSHCGLNQYDDKTENT
jgi:hypothetical protein